MKEIIYQNKVLYPKILWNRPVHFYKAQAGKVLILADSKGMTGAAILTSEAVFRSGTGLLLLGFPAGLKRIYADILPEAMTLALAETPSESLSKKAEKEILDNASSCDVAIIGPGLSQNAETVDLVWRLIFSLKIPIVLDADGLYALAKGIEVMRKKEDLKFLSNFFQKRPNLLIITPHQQEAARLVNAINPDVYRKNINGAFVDKNKIEIAKILSIFLNSHVVLKGHQTVVTDGKKIVIDTLGGPELATAGSGDVLSGIVGSFAGQNKKDLFESTCTSVYLHSLSGKIARKKIGERSVIASDIIRFLPEAIKLAESSI